MTPPTAREISHKTMSELYRIEGIFDRAAMEYAIERALVDYRNAALEEVAKMLEDDIEHPKIHGSGVNLLFNDLAENIRSLKEKEAMPIKKPSDRKPSNRIYQIIGHTSSDPEWNEKAIEAIIEYLDEQAEKEVASK